MAEEAAAYDPEMERHATLVREMAELYQPMMDLASDGMYVYLDDNHKACNENLAKLWGYTPHVWNGVAPFLDNLVAPESRQTLQNAYAKCRQTYASGQITFVGLRHDGTTFKAVAAMVPIMYQDEFFTLNLIRAL